MEYKQNYQLIYKIGYTFEREIKKEYELINEFKKNHKWDAYGNNNIKIQIKLHKEGTDIRLGSISNYAYMEDDFLLIIGGHQNEYRQIEDFDINNIKIKTYYIDCNKWNKCFNKTFNKNYIKNINKKNWRDIEKFQNEYYIKYGNYDDNCFTKINYRTVNRNTGRHKEGKEKKWTVSIKKEKVYDFLKMFENVPIIDYSEFHLFNNILL